VEQANATAAELLRFCAFLAPDAIPEELVTESAAELGPLLKPMVTDPSILDAAIRELLKYSLIHRDPESKMLSIHRLVQEVLKDQMNEETQRQWAERTVRAVNQVFPFPEYANWDRCQRYLPHAQMCSPLIEQWNLLFNEVASLLNKVGYYQWQRGEYEQVESLHKRALAIREQVLGPTHHSTAVSLAHLGLYYWSQGKYADALPLWQRDLAIKEQELGLKHPETARSLNNLAALYYNQGKYAEALPLCQRALAIDEETYGSNHPDVARDLNNLANLFNVQGKYEQAESLYQRALTIREQKLGPEHPDTAWSVANLAWLYMNQGKYEQAKLLYQRALAIREKVLGSDHPDTVANRRNYNDLLERMNRKR